ncbi:MAG: hypothetical protein KOO60_13475 [Gemmatimonadales bacterium]|nr:hypothetical protein [Gemmatimonadales bacterium]
MEFSIKHNDDFFEIKVSGEAELSKYGDFLDALIGHDKWKPGTPVLVDEMELDTSPLTVGNVQQIADMCGQRRAELGPAKCALLAGRDLEFGMIRMWGVFVEGKWDIVSDLFTVREEAIGWLKE